MTAYGDDPAHHAIKGGVFVCTAAPDAPCRTSPTCDCENWCGCDGSPEDARDSHDDDHCCMTTVKPGQECWMKPWVDAVGLADSYDQDDWPNVRIWGETGFPDGPLTVEWDQEYLTWTYATPALDAAYGGTP